MNTSQKYWIPKGLPEELQVALSIPGKPPKTRAEHRNRLWALLETLAEELDELNGQGRQHKRRMSSYRIRRCIWKARTHRR